MESKNLKEHLRSCDYCSTSFEEHNACYQRTAKESGARARACVTGARGSM
jgi:hypothetical protein